MLTEENLLQNELYIDSVSQIHLKETAMWGKFLAIAGFIGSGIVALVGIFAGSIMSRFTKGLQNGGDTMMAGGFVMVFYIILAGVLFVMCLYLYRFATKMQAALKTNDQENLNLSLLNLKIYYRFAGILTIIYLALLLMVLVAGMIAALAM